MMKNKAFCSWSGGKDSCLALYRALQNGFDVRNLLTMFDETENRSRTRRSALTYRSASRRARH